MGNIRGGASPRILGLHRYFLCATALAGVAVPTCAFARDSSTPTAPATDPAAAPAAAPSGPTAQTNSGEIVVTALKRATRLQDTPISISAISGDAISNGAGKSINDLRSSVPSLTFVDVGPSQRRVVIRGIQSAGEALVGTYYDETPVTGSIGATNDAGATTPELRLFDVNRVEVLRGPQGTLYGGGSMGGTLRVIFNKPSNEYEESFDGSVSGTQHGGLNYDMNAMINAPLIDGKLAFRGVAYYSINGGYVDNTRLNQSNVNHEKDYGGHFMLRLTPNERLTIDADGYFTRMNTQLWTWYLEAGKYKTTSYTEQPTGDQTDLFSLTANYDLDVVKLTAVGSYLSRDLYIDTDTSLYYRALAGTATVAGISPKTCQGTLGAGSPCTPAQQSAFNQHLTTESTSALTPSQAQHTYTGEFRISNEGKSRLNWTLGAFFSDRISHVDATTNAADPNTGIILRDPADEIGARFVNDELKQVAGFGEISWDVTRKLNLTFGGRYFDYQRTVTGYTTIADYIVGSSFKPRATVKTNDTGWVSKFNASYKFTPDIMLYAEASQGFRPGGANQVIGLPGALTPYKADSLWNYEVGLKNSFFNRKLFLDVDVYQINWKDIQVSGRTPDGLYGYITNAGKARVRGVEAELSAQPIRGLTVALNASYTNAILTEDQAAAGNLQAAPNLGLKGDRIPYVPKQQGGASAEYRWALSETLDGFVHIDGNYSGGSYSDFRPTYLYTRHVPSYELANMRVGVERGDGKKWGVYLFVNNLFNATAITRESASALGGNLTIVNSAPPRTIGLNVRSNF